jgi:hypothetical protein
MIVIKGAVKFAGLVKIKIVQGWEGLSVKWTEVNTTWDQWF